MSLCVRRVGWMLARVGLLLVLHTAGPAMADDVPGANQRPNFNAIDTTDTPNPTDDAHAADQAHAAYEQALQALALQQWTQAELLLERALMFQPEHAEALLQLATLLAQRDRLESAQALIGMLLHDPRTPPQHRRHLQALLDNTYRKADAPMVGGTPATPLPTARTQMLWTAGYTRNPLGTTSATQLTLTLPEGPVTLPLAARAEGGTVATVAMHHQRTSGLELYAQIQAASQAQAHTAGRFALGGPLGLKNHHWSLSTQRALDGSTRHSASLLRTLDANAQLMAGIFRESSFGRTDWLVRGQRSFMVASRWPVTTWGEYEHGRTGAPGAVRGGVQALVSIAPRWQLQGQVSGQWDTSGYSKLLENNAARRLLTAHFELEYRWPSPVLAGQAVLSTYAARRWSNLALFDWNDHGVRISWLRQW